MDSYHGQIRTPADAIKLFEACRLGLLPRVQRRLSEKERQSIRSGSVFIWDEREAGMRRWTDGKSWSASRVSGSFLTYREMEGKRGGGAFTTSPLRRVAKTSAAEMDRDADGDGSDGYRYKADGLIKQSFSLTTSTGQHLHLISYYSRPLPNTPELKIPSTDPALRHIVPPVGMYPDSTIHLQAPGSRLMPSPPRNTFSAPPHLMQAGYGWPPTPAQTPGHTYSRVFSSNAQTRARHAMSNLPPPQNLGQAPYQMTPNTTPRLPYPHDGPGSKLDNPSRVQTSPPGLRHHPPLASLPPVSHDSSIREGRPSPTRGLSGETVHTRLSSSTTPVEGIPSLQNTTVPSIAKLLHGNDVSSKEVDYKTLSRSSSPGNAWESSKQQESQKAQDILHDRLHHQGEDQRAIRVLDRKFCH